MKKLGLASAVLSMLLLGGCGGSNNTDTIKSKKFVIIFTNAQAGACETSALRDQLAVAGYQDFDTRETSLDTRCATFGKVTDKNCKYIAWTGTPGNVNCVVGVNSIRTGKLASDADMYETFEILESALQ